MSSGNSKNSVYVKKFAEGKSILVTARAGTWTTWDDSSRAGYSALPRSKEVLLKLPHAIVASKLLFQSKGTQLVTWQLTAIIRLRYPMRSLIPRSLRLLATPNAFVIFTGRNLCCAQCCLIVFKNPIRKTHNILKMNQDALAKHSDCV